MNTTVQETMAAKTSFIELPSLTASHITPPISISNTQFALATDKSSSKLKTFNSITKTWTDFDYSKVLEIADKPQYEEDFRFFYGFNYHTLSYDEINNKYYIYSKKYLLQIDMNKSDENLELYVNPFCSVGRDPVSVFVDGKLHIIGGYHSNLHIIFNPKTKKWIKHHKFAGIKGLSMAALIHVKSKNVLYLMGGYDQQHIFDSSDVIWRYSFVTQKWEHLSVKLPKAGDEFPHFLTTNERYIVVTLKMFDENGNMEVLIFYLDLEMEPLRFIESSFKPKFEASHAIMTGSIEMSRKIVYGYTRLFGQNMIIPLDMIEMIMTFYDQEWVHFFQLDRVYGTIKHLMVSIKDIIPSYCQNN